MTTQDDQLDRSLGELREQLRAAHHDAGAGPVGPVLAVARARLVAEAGAPPTRVAAGRRRWPAMTAAAAVVVVLVAGGMLVGLPGTGPATAEAKAVLERAAAETIEATDPALGPDQYRYIESRSWDLSAGVDDDRFVAALVEDRTRYWAPVDPGKDWLMIRGRTGAHECVVGTEADADRIGLAGAPDPPDRVTVPCGRFYAGLGGDLCGGPGTWQSPTPEFVAGLPRDPGELFTRLEHDAPVDGRGRAELLVYAADLLRSPARVPADLRAALYLALSRVDGLTLTPGSVNLDGRSGTALGIDNGVDRTEIIVDPRTGEFIGGREVVTAGDLKIPEGTVTGYGSVSSAVVDRIGEVP